MRCLNHLLRRAALVLSLFSLLLYGCGVTVPPNSSSAETSAEEMTTAILDESTEPVLNWGDFPITEAYKYPLRPGVEGWDVNWSHGEMVEACSIPKETVDGMNTLALAQPEGAEPPKKLAADTAQFTINEPYDYPVRPGDKDWASADGLPGMAAKCQIPEEVQEHLTKEALFETVLDYPLLVNINAYMPDYGAGARQVWNYFNGLRELVDRQDAQALIEGRLAVIDAAENAGTASPEELLQKGQLQGILTLFER